MVTDIVYLVRPGHNNLELLFSLRSLQNFPHGRVWIVGYKPRWVKGVEYIPANGSANAQMNVYRNILTACRMGVVPDEFVIFNDDFMVTEPVTGPPAWYRGPLRDHIASIRVGDWWLNSLTTTDQYLRERGFKAPKSYELHVPFHVHKERMRETLERAANVTPLNPPQWRTLYGNEWKIRARKHPDCKAKKPGALAAPYHSTTDANFAHFKADLLTLFPNRSPYEGQY